MTKPKLLLADNSVTIRKVVELTFADEGIDVSTAADGESAMQRFVEMQPDIVLVDVGLDGTNGYHICEMIKADEATKHIPVMLLVGSFVPFDQDEANRVGADGFLTKPFNSIRDLVGRVRMLLEYDAGPVVEPINPDKVGDKSESIYGDSPSDFMHSAPETEDIDHLYQSSFGKTVRIDEFETLDNLLGDAGMDDEMIEASRSAPNAEENSADLPTTAQGDEQAKEFDWSFESMVTDSLSEVKPEHSVVENDPESENAIADASYEDRDEENDIVHDLPDSVDHLETDVSTSEAQSDAATMNTIEPSSEPDFVVSFRAPTTDSVDDREPPIELLPNDSDRAGEVNTSDGFKAARDDFSSFAEVDPAIHQTIPYEIGEQPPVTKIDAASPISPDLIDKIAERVVRQLSDKAVREIAQVEVPRIAEKLIREALEKENKA